MIAKFPDAPTERGARHLRKLAAACQEGFRTAVIFIVQMEDVKYFTPNKLMEGQFAETLSAAHAAGVEVLCYDCRVSEQEISISKKVPVIF